MSEQNIEVFEDELLNLKAYPKFMYMDVYGNGCKSWDQSDGANTDDVVFRAKYMRMDLAINKAEEARHSGYENARIKSLKETKDALTMTVQELEDMRGKEFGKGCHLATMGYNQLIDELIERAKG